MQVQDLIGKRYRIDLGAFVLHFELSSVTSAELCIAEGRAAAPTGHHETLEVELTEVRDGLILMSWREQSGVTVTRLDDHERHVAHARITRPGGRLECLQGSIMAL
jgi:hypothetical protein